MKKATRTLCWDLGNLERLHDFRHCGCIRVEEIRGAIRRMSKGRATESGEIPMDFGISIGRANLEWLIELFNVIFKTKI